MPGPAFPPRPTSRRSTNGRWTGRLCPFTRAGSHILRRAEDAADRFADKTSGWSEIALDGVDVIEVEGSHHSFAQASGLAVLGPLLCSAMELALARPEQWARAPARPDPERAFRLEARLAAREGDLQRELAACRSAFQIDPEQPVWFMRHHAEALAMAGDAEGAIQAARAAVTRDPWPMASLVLLAPTMQKLGQRGFLQRMKHMADVVPATHPSVEVWRARAYAMTGSGTSLSGPCCADWPKRRRISSCDRRCPGNTPRESASPKQPPSTTRSSATTRLWRGPGGTSDGCTSRMAIRVRLSRP